MTAPHIHSSGEAPAEWRPVHPGDLDAIMAIQDRVHTMLPERREIFVDKLQSFGAGCRVLVRQGQVVGYGIAHPWLIDDVPAMDTLLGELPKRPDCLFLHDVAILPEGRSKGAGRAFVDHVTGIARELGLMSLALVSVYDSFPVWGRFGFSERRVPQVIKKLAIYGAGARYLVAQVG